MKTQKGSSTIALIAIAAVALLVGIWIGSEKDIIVSEIQEATQSMKKMEVKKAMEQEVVPAMDVMEKAVDGMMMEKMEESADQMMEKEA